MKKEEKIEDIGFSNSFVEEMNNDRTIVKKSNRASIVGEITSYFLYGMEALRNLLFYMFIFSKNNSSESMNTVGGLFIFLGMISIILSFIILKNFVKVSKILNGGTLPFSDKLFLIATIFYYFYAHAFLNISFLVKFTNQSTFFS